MSRTAAPKANDTAGEGIPASRRTFFAWAALLVLMFTSLASAYLPLGPWNLVAGVAIALLKSLIVLAVFMGLLRAPALLRIIAALGFATLSLLFALSSVDYATRDHESEPVQHARSTEHVSHSGLADAGSSRFP